MSQERIWVDPEFKKKLKLIAAENEMSILKLTKSLAKPEENCKRKKIEWDFKM